VGVGDRGLRVILASTTRLFLEEAGQDVAGGELTSSHGCRITRYGLPPLATHLQRALCFFCCAGRAPAVHRHAIIATHPAVGTVSRVAGAGVGGVWALRKGPCFLFISCQL
jgi:hypothetical protein